MASQVGEPLVLDLLEQIDDAVLTEARARLAGLRVERHQLVPRRDHDDAALLAVAPVRHGAMNLARRTLEAGAFVRPPHPQRFAVGGVGGDDGTPLPGREIQHPVHHDRRRLGRHGLGGRAEVVEFPRPRDLQVLDVVASDLIEWRVPGASLVVAVAAPFSRGWSGTLTIEGMRPYERCYE